MTDERMPSHDREAERAVIGSCLRSNDSIDDAGLAAGEFYVLAHGLAWQALLDLRAAGKPADTVTVCNLLDEAGKVEEAGGVGYLVELWDAAPSSANVTHYAEIVKEHALYRAIVRECRELIRDAEGRAAPAGELASTAQQKMYELASAGFRREPVPVKVASAEAWAGFAANVAALKSGNWGRLRGLSTGIGELDVLLCGLQPGQLYILAARPSQGKTAMLCNWLHHLSLGRRVPTFFASLEQPRVEVCERLYMIESGVDYQRYRQCKLDPCELARVDDARLLVEASPLWIEDGSGQTVTQIAVNARRLRAKAKIELVAVDYLTLIRSEGRHQNRENEVSAISRALKGLARDLGLPVVCLAQVNRQPENRPDRKPKLNDLRDSGSIEMDADAVMFLYRPDPMQSVTQIVVAKQRNGPVGDVNCVFNRACLRFEPFEGRPQCA